MIEKLSSAAAFIEGGIQDASDDSCSICLESFCNNNPSTVSECSASTKFFMGLQFALLPVHAVAQIFLDLLQVTECKHEFHLQCILEWSVSAR